MAESISNPMPKLYEVISNILTVMQGVAANAASGATVTAMNGTVNNINNNVNILNDVQEWSDTGDLLTDATDFNAAEETVFQVDLTSRYELKGIYIDISNFTATATITLRVYKNVASGYEQLGADVTVVVGTDSNLVPISDLAHYDGIRVTAQSDNALDTAVQVPYGYLQVERE
jgi:hypothetical protein